MYHYVSRLLICTTVMVGVCVPASSARDLRVSTQATTVTATCGGGSLCALASQLSLQIQSLELTKQDVEHKGFGQLGQSVDAFKPWANRAVNSTGASVDQAAAWLLCKQSVELLI